MTAVDLGEKISKKLDNPEIDPTPMVPRPLQVGRAEVPLPPDVETASRLFVLERLVIELSKHVAPQAPLSIGAVVALDELKARHPDV